MEKLYVAFHKFSVVEGNECDKSVGVKAPEIVWQLFLEKLFMKKLSSSSQHYHEN